MVVTNMTDFQGAQTFNRCPQGGVEPSDGEHRAAGAARGAGDDAA
jgi:hypothetical protein